MPAAVQQLGAGIEMQQELGEIVSQYRDCVPLEPPPAISLVQASVLQQLGMGSA